MVKALVVLSPGGEEMEIVGSVANLRRIGVCDSRYYFKIMKEFKLKVEVTLAGLTGNDSIKTALDMKILPDVALSSVDKTSFDIIVSF
jgi:hypothetical protein